MDGICIATLNTNKEYGITSNGYAAKAPNIHAELLKSYIKSKGIDCELVYNATAERVKAQEPTLVILVCSGANPASSTLTIPAAIEFIMVLVAR